MGLQLVNILKDVTDDRERGWSFIPRSVCDAQGLAVEQLLDPQLRRQAHLAVAPIFKQARAFLDQALLYTLAIPAEADSIRLFCLLPLWMAVRTLVLAEGNDAMFIPGQAVKITRQEVEQLIAECITYGASDDLLRKRYEALWAPTYRPPSLTLSSTLIELSSTKSAVSGAG